MSIIDHAAPTLTANRLQICQHTAVKTRVGICDAEGLETSHVLCQDCITDLMPLWSELTARQPGAMVIVTGLVA